MRLYSGKIPVIAQEIVKALNSADAIETDSPSGVIGDLEAVLKEYLRTERAISEEAKDRMERQGMSHAVLGKVKAQLAAERNFPDPDEFLPYIIQQLMEMLFHSANVEEVFAEDMELRKMITPILRKHLDVEEALDREIRARLKHLTEGTAAFEIEYQKLVDQMKRKKHLA
jgi:uncharacterized protein